MRALRLLTLLVPVLGACASDPPPEMSRDRPNVLVVLADDLGYSDIGPYGSEIRTPTLGELAESGLVATSFYVAPDGGPTRAMLLTGVDHHLAGIGVLPGGVTSEEDVGYQQHLNDRVVTVASLLRDAGYHTVMAGRWELGVEPEQRPAARGFERSFALLDDMASYWADMQGMTPGREKAHYSRDGQLVETLPEDFYSTRDYTDFLIESIDANRASARPFFAYLAYQAPHSPLSLPEDWLDRYAGRYEAGFQKLQERRLTALKRRGMVEKTVDPFPGLPTVPRWAALSDEEKARQARKMELYAGMVENLDFHLGRLLDHLGEIGERRNTLVFFLSDNGASASDRGPNGIDSDDRDWLAQVFPANELENWGRPGSFVEVGAGWGQTSSVPFRMFKGTQAEGGIRSPLVVSGPGVERGELTKALLHVTDVAATVLDVAGVEYPASYGGRRLEPLQGRSLAPLMAGDERKLRGDDDWLGFELGGSRALRRDDWKASWMPPPLGSADWRLYRIKRDPSELYDRAKDEPEELEELVALWEEYARSHGVILPAEAPPELAER